MVEYRTGGWRVDLESRETLLWNSINGYESITPLLRSSKNFNPPEVVDPRDWLVIEDQLQLGSCQGHALSTCVEMAYKFETNETIQFSRMFAYIMSQRKDNIQGDHGSTISGGAITAKDDGLCLETTWPYTGRYTTDIPQGAMDEAKRFRIKTTVRIQSYDDVYTFLGSLLGGINIGIMWGLPDAPVIERYQSGPGGHAVSFVGYSSRKDSKGRPYIIMANSWGIRWGDRGFAEWSPTAVEEALAHRFTEAYGMTDMLSIEPRKINYVFL